MSKQNGALREGRGALIPGSLEVLVEVFTKRLKSLGQLW